VKATRVGLLIGWLILCAVNIALWPRNKFEWMLQEPGSAVDKLTFCSLPVDPDAFAGALLAIAPVLITLAFGAFLTARTRRIAPALLGGLALLAFWFMRFEFVHFGC
jgi:hypothetical protein